MAFCLYSSSKCQLLWWTWSLFSLCLHLCLRCCVFVCYRFFRWIKIYILVSCPWLLTTPRLPTNGRLQYNVQHIAAVPPAARGANRHAAGGALAVTSSWHHRGAAVCNCSLLIPVMFSADHCPPTVTHSLITTCPAKDRLAATAR